MVSDMKFLVNYIYNDEAMEEPFHWEDKKGSISIQGGVK